MNLGVQYYRAPFPREEHWDEDFARIKASGLNCVQLWVLWGWVEATPGEYNFADYDRLVALAAKHGLGVILSSVAEIQPCWIHREVPGSEMIDHMGRIVVSSNRGECHFGITPGGCTDNPAVWQRMSGFLNAVVERYRHAENLIGWDAWNETRWNVQADGLVCFCEHTIRAFHEWLERKYGSLAGLNAAWLRRYSAWDEVRPGKLEHRPYTEMMAFEHFLTERANEHARQRYALIKALDNQHPVTLHGPVPCPLIGGSRMDQAMNRGNDWDFADTFDGVGCSSFPKWFHFDDADFGMRIEFVRSAAQGKRVWLSELQGGRSSIGFQLDEPVDALTQQRWIWNGKACGAETVIFWCWRDEVFGRESAGFGLSGRDGKAEERLAAMAQSGRLFTEHKELLSAYRPATPEVGVFFSPQSYYLNWAEEGKSDRMIDALQGYCRALGRSNIPYTVVEEEHLGVLEHLKILFMPHTLVVDDHTAARLAEFVQQGGTLVCESECGAFASNGLYRYPEERFTTELTGVCEIGRRTLTDKHIITTLLDERELTLPVVQWLSPYTAGVGEVLAEHADGPLIVQLPVGQGNVVLCGGYPGEGYWHQRTADFETYLEQLALDAGYRPHAEVLAPQPTADEFVYLKYGRSGEHQLLFVFFPASAATAQLRLAANFFTTTTVTDLISGEQIDICDTPNGQQCTVPANNWRFSVLCD